jgi:hypothetical protein
MRNQIPLAPRKPFDVTVHIVLNDFGPLGRAYVEADETEADEAAVVENILSIAFNTVEGWARDVTEDIAQAVLSKAQEERRSISVVVQDFLVRTLGVDAPVGD